MSGAVARRPGTNVVPMPQTAPAPAPMPMWSGYPPGGMPAGCCPPGGMDALLQCYCDVQSATAFISKVVQDLAANDPAFQQSLVDAIVASGSNVPLIGVTNGAPAQPGQVGEWVNIDVTFSITAAAQTQSVTVGVLQPGDWDIWYDIGFTVPVVSVVAFLSPQPVGVAGNMATTIYSGTPGQDITLESVPTQALLSVPTLIVFSVQTNNVAAGAAGSGTLVFAARRVR